MHVEIISIYQSCCDGIMMVATQTPLCRSAPTQLMTQDITGLRAFKLIFVSVWDMNLTHWDLGINFVDSINMQNSMAKETLCQMVPAQHVIK